MFLRNGWYAAIWSNDLQARPIGRTLLNEKVVLFRNGRGQAAALEDCCCHRAAPLSKGEVSRDYLACGYHGLKYDINGQCVEVPGQTMIPRGAKVRSYPVCEKWGAVWIWMGESGQGRRVENSESLLARRSGLDGNARLHPLEVELSVSHR